MSLDPTSAAALGTAIAGVVSGLTPEQKANLILAWQTICIQLYASLSSDLSGSVDTGDIADGAITTAKIANGGSNTVLRMSGSTMGWGTLTAAHIAANAIGNSELASNAVMNVNVASNAAISGAKINPDFDNQTVQSTGPFITGSVNVAVNSSSPSGPLFTPQSGGVYLCTAKYRSGSNTTAVALALISRHSSVANVYISNLHATTLGFELDPLSDVTVRLYSTSGSTTTASVSWLRLH